MAAWSVDLKESAVEDLRFLGKDWREVLTTAVRMLSQDPLTETRQMKTLRPNPVAERELRLLGKYRVLFTVDAAEKSATIILVGEKRRNALYVRGKRFTTHESGSTK